MYTKRLLLAFAFALATFSTQAQQQLDRFEYGVRIGLNFGSLFNADKGEIYGVKSGLAIGGLAKFRLSRWIAFQPELLYAQQGAVDTLTTAFTSTPIQVRNSYLVAPLLVKLYPARKFSLQIGPQLGILISSKIDGSDSRSEFIPVDLALAFGVEYEFNKGLLLGLRFSSSLIDIDENDTVSSLSGNPKVLQNGYFLLSTGWRF
ncbi:porin family protein [Tunicatimonas pelagia]|uniref:porin family protein n=1 Tax=Tunicatimonas pelagia TaxID=931531 RepID=UPI00266696A0|nr:porin family protein [Tunicatimonas pelagia]WKN44416.1 porin family protein [Tunicatimonas pelagia]